MKTRTTFILLVLCFAGQLQSQALSWVDQFGGTLEQVSYSLATDAQGNVYTTGYFEGIVDFDPGAGIFNLTATGKYDLFITKVDASGQLVWAKRIGDDGPDGFAVGMAIIIGPSGHVYVTGRFSGLTDFDPNAGEFNLVTVQFFESCPLDLDLFILKLTDAGDFVWVSQIGAPDGNDIGTTIALGPNEEVYVAGHVASNSSADVDFDPGTGIYLVDISPVGAVTFLLKLDSDGAFIWVDPFTSSCVSAFGCGAFRYNKVYINGLTVDATGQVFAAGSFSCNTDFDPSTVTLTVSPVGGQNSFILKLNASGGLEWVKQFGGNPNDANDIVLDGSGNIYTTGTFQKTVDFDPNATTKNLKSFSNSNDIYVSKLNASGNYVWAVQMGGTGYDNGTSIDLDGSGNVYTTGSFSGNGDFNPATAKYTLKSAGGSDVFVSKLNTSGAFAWAVRWGGISNDNSKSIDVDASNNVYNTGEFLATVDFDPGGGTLSLTSLGGKDVYLHKMTQTEFLAFSAEDIENTFAPEVNVFPNPAQERVMIAFTHDTESNYEITLLDMTGRLMTKYQGIAHSGDNEHELQLVNIPQGMYQILLITDDIRQMKILVVE
ncbi:MAG TPA: SBBP repeat-containing protein [Saprospiraceae bacterium]|nr:SBBP repeat-containing protein [Saprospiraceae bacterium]